MARPPRFIYGFLSQSTQAYNMKVPWTISNQDGAFAMNYNEEEAMHQNLVCWAKTNWGERPMSFRFGLDVRRHLFDPIQTTIDHLERNARQQLSDYFPTFEIIKLEFLTKEQDSNIEDNEIVFNLEGKIGKGKKNVKISVKMGL